MRLDAFLGDVMEMPHAQVVQLAPGVRVASYQNGPDDSVFVVAETTGGHHTLWALNPDTGHRKWRRNLDTQKDRNRLAEAPAILRETVAGVAPKRSSSVGCVGSFAMPAGVIVTYRRRPPTPPPKRLPRSIPASWRLCTAVQARAKPGGRGKLLR